MKSKVPKSYFLIPALYIVLVALFIQLHLTGGGHISTEKVGPVQLWIKKSGGMNKGVEEARLSLYGLSVDLTEGLEFRAQDGASRRVAIEAADTREGSIRLALENGGMLRIAPGYPVGAGMFRYPQLYAPSPDFRGVAFSYENPEQNGQELPVLPFALQRAGEIQLPRERLPVALVREDGQSFLCASARQPLVEGNTVWCTLSENAGAPDVVVSPYDGENLSSYWVFGDQEPTGQDEFAKTYAAFLDTAYAGWKDRYRSGSIGWRRTEGVEAAEEKIIAAYAAESLRRNGTVGLERFSAAVENGIDQESLLASPFIDTMVELDTQVRMREQQRADELSAAVQRGDAGLFSGAHDLAPFLVLHGRRELISEVDDFAASLAQGDRLSANQAAGLFVFYVKAAADYPRLFPKTAELGDSFFSQLLPHFVRTKTEIVYAGSEQADVGIGLHLARSLIRYGDIRDASFPASLGFTMATSYLARADEEGFLPQTMNMSANELADSDRDLAPEKVYPWISNNTFYPRVVSLADQIGAQVRLFTAAQAVGAVRNGATVTITLDYEVGETEHVLVRGLGSFSNFFFYGLRWSSDRRFQTYAVGGWYYDGGRDTLYMKIRHQQKVERVMFDQ